jgi:hypothetical protein
VAQTDDIDSYSTYEMCALWLLSYDHSKLPSADSFYQWLMQGGDAA